MESYLQRSYWATKAKYEKFRRRLNKRVKNGSFYKLSLKKQKQLVNRVEKLLEKLKSLQLALKYGMAGAAFSLALSAGSVHAQKANGNQPFKRLIEERKAHKTSIVQKQMNPTGPLVQIRGTESPFGGSNPFDGLLLGWGSLDMADLDGDGDLDIALGTYVQTDGYSEPGIKYFKRSDADGLAYLDRQEDEANPFASLTFHENPAITFADIDGDNDLDLFAVDQVDYGKKMRFFKNEGTTNTPSFVEKTGSDNPFDLEDFSYPDGLSFVDIDGDGDLDFFISHDDYSDGYSIMNLRYFENTGSNTAPSFTEVIGDNNPLNSVTVEESDLYPAFADFDNDGDLDVVIGGSYGDNKYYKNTGSATNPVFEELTDANNPFDGIWVGDEFKPYILDQDNDGDLDVFAFNDANIMYFENTGSATNLELTNRNGINGGYLSIPEFADLDGDGDLDLLLGSYSYYTPLFYYKNTGTATNPVYEDMTDNSPFSNLNLGYLAFPSMVDIDNDGDLDFFNCSYGTYHVTFYKNTGTATNPVFQEQTGVDNPLEEVTFDEFAALTFADVDGDGDLDCFLGTTEGGEYGYGVLKFYRNVGSATAPEFGEATNPVSFDFSNGYIIMPEMADFDNDGDVDLLVGMYWEDETTEGAVLKYFKNDGTTTEPNFVEQTGIDNPFEDLVPLDFYFVMPALADIDNDGDIDLAIGTYGGGLIYFRNENGVSIRQTSDDYILERYYPNPVQNELNLVLNDANTGSSEISVYDITGKLMESAIVDENLHTVNMTNLPAGVYFVKINQQNTIETFKVVKK